MDIGGRDGVGDGVAEGERWLAIAVRLLEVRDLIGCKRFAERAMEADPLLDGVDQVIAISDVLLAGRRRINNHVDWYGVLQLPPPSPTDPGDPAAIKRQYRRLALLVNPDRTSVSGADSAYRLVSDAYAVLSDPTKKSLFDAELHIANSTAGATATAAPISSSKPFHHSATTGNSFWTVCPSCCHVHQYSREYVNRALRCPNCCRAFQAAELPAPPPVVPGTDMYYCSWGFFPLGFPGASNLFASSAPDLNTEWKPLFSTFPDSAKEKPFQPSNHQQNHHSNAQNNANKGNVMEPQSAGPATRSKKMAVKKVGRPRKYPLGSGNRGKVNESVEITAPAPVPVPAVAPEAWANSGAMPTSTGGVDININQEAKIGSESEVHVDDYNINFHIDVNATDEILDNLQNLPFLRDEELHLRMP
ncbi:hypothetical protein Cni_G11495 [Canna indica]|uniref:J domain-containing protein n=1 Tax=Canna indica TaxID=4628 RepID=A0AAQ3QAX5_9LILI|nr:hypothetical protein Cni_G11495 [Canna indica]